MDIFQNIAEQRILESYSRGEFDNLKGFGREVDNTEYFSVPEEERIAYHILKNAGLVPHEIEVRKELYQLIQEIRKTTDTDIRDELAKKYAILESRLHLQSKGKL